MDSNIMSTALMDRIQGIGEDVAVLKDRSESQGESLTTLSTDIRNLIIEWNRSNNLIESSQATFVREYEAQAKRQEITDGKVIELEKRVTALESQEASRKTISKFMLGIVSLGSALIGAASAIAVLLGKFK